MAQATVESCRWRETTDNLGTPAGYYHLEFVYSVPGLDGAPKLRRGSVSCPGKPSLEPYRPGEQLAVRYNPHSSCKHRLVGEETNYDTLEAILVIVFFALTAGFLLYTF